MTRKTVLLWIPTSGPPRGWSIVKSLVGLETPNNDGYALLPTPPANPEDTWNYAAQTFLDSGYEWLLSIHDDTVFAPKTLVRLLSHDKPLISALAFNRHVPCLPFVYGRWTDRTKDLATIEGEETMKWLQDHMDAMATLPVVLEPCPSDALRSVVFTSLSCCLIHRTVIKAIHPPWFLWNKDSSGGEDTRFFKLAKAAGFQGWVDRSVVVGHLRGEDEPVGPLDFFAWAAIVEERK